jgi:hypothetical protein
MFLMRKLSEKWGQNSLLDHSLSSLIVVDTTQFKMEDSNFPE